MATQCSGVQTPCVAAQPDATRFAANALEAIVFREVLKPLAEALGPIGDVATESVADALFVRPKT